MCSTWLIDGKYCESGQDLIAALGPEKARLVNECYSIADVPLSDEQVAESCLCHVNPHLMKEATGKMWVYAVEHDAFVVVEPPK